MFAKLKAKAKQAAAGMHDTNLPGSQQQSPSQSQANLAHPPPPLPQAQQIKPYWQPSFSSGTLVSQDWKHQTGAHGWGNNELQNYIPDATNSFHDGRLIVRAISQGGQFTSARLTSHQTLSKQRGSLVFVASPPCNSGIWPAIWLLPNEPFQWPNEAEIDILETWNADCVNHSCLHWGHFNGEDWNKHRAIETNIEGMAGRPVRYEFVWEQDESTGRNDGGGKAVWYIDGRLVMKAAIPQGARRISDWQIIINVAMGGNVCQGKTPADGYYDLVVHELRLLDIPTTGWSRFEADFETGPEGHP
ncbi:glycoside hydrolase family 16 protein [Calycina marina]|uniref:Glycoside hydrolase family 16 protein n=1 Tax=Calycina marina TaxID=1763456 RepID=A0A9P8CEW0_9HELO|nr:glycoside hydrolase family 16 protein [Calycina marina]